MTPGARFGEDAAFSVIELLERHDARSILVVAGKNSYRTSGAEAALHQALESRAVTRFTDFSPSFELHEVERGLDVTASLSPDLILAVGGGSAIDMGKLLAILSAQTGDPATLAEKSTALVPATLPVIALPTTAGTGSEATHFATVFIGDRKLSIAHPSMLPTHSVVDPKLTFSMTPKLTAVTGMDALCQAVESLWSVGSNNNSLGFAREAAQLAIESLRTAVRRPNPEARAAMAKAAHLSGKAINISKTTACHALSYGMTSRFGVPHGLAVALTLAPMLEHNAGATDASVQDPRGAAHVRGAIDEVVQMLGCSDPGEAAHRVTRLLSDIGLPTRLRDVGICTEADRQWLAGTVNLERLANNPRRLSEDNLIRVLDHIA